MNDELNLDELERDIKETAPAWGFAMIDTGRARKLIALARKGLELDRFIEHNEPTIDRIESNVLRLTARSERYEKALRLATVRLQILVDRMRGCIENGGHHGLMGESQAYVDEAREAWEEKP